MALRAFGNDGKRWTLMTSFIGRLIRRWLPPLLAKVNLKLVHIESPFTDYKCYIPFRQTIEAARDAGLSVGDYIETKYDRPGTVSDTLRQMQTLGVFESHIDRVCEIGPGSGRYLQQTRRHCTPSYYEVYETSPSWGQWLARHQNVVLLPADGYSLRHTDSGSIDLVHAHKVLPGQSFLTTCRYLVEMARVVRIGGKMVFDIVTEECMDNGTLQDWLSRGAGYEHYPNVIPKTYAINLLSRLGLRLDGTFFESMTPGVTHYFVLTKNGSGPADISDPAFQP
jgi:SAM-dependent methyltransferase